MVNNRIPSDILKRINYKWHFSNTSKSFTNLIWAELEDTNRRENSKFILADLLEPNKALTELVFPD